MMWIIWILLGVACAVTLYAYHVAFYSPPGRRDEPYVIPGSDEPSPKMAALMEETKALPFEEVSITSFDGLTLRAKYYHRCNGAPVHIQCHGYRGSALRDFCGGSKLAREADHNALVIDHRGHGKSGGKTITFGILERQDVLSWARYAEQRFGADTPLFLSGISMGASTVLMAAELPLPESVVGIVADCPYSSPEAIIRRVCAQRGFPPALTMPFVHLAARVLGGFRLRACSALEAVTQAKIPILLIHGEADNFVPCDMSRAIREACASECTLLTFPGAEHGTSFLADAGRYRTALQTFMARCLETKKESC